MIDYQGLTEVALSKKHFIAMAAEIKKLPRTGNRRVDVANLAMRVIRTENPSFSSDRFYRACGLTPSGAEVESLDDLLAHVDGLIDEMAMTRQHFISMAAAIKQLPKTNVSRIQVAKAMCDVFKEYSPRFDEGRFYRACGLNPRSMEPNDGMSESSTDLVNRIIQGESSEEIVSEIVNDAKFSESKVYLSGPAAPTAKNLANMLDPEQATELAKILKNAHGHSAVDRALETANKMLDGHGVESIQYADHQVDGYYMDIALLYVNMGDTYNQTVMYDTERGKFWTGTYGDWVEYSERKGMAVQ